MSLTRILLLQIINIFNYEWPAGFSLKSETNKQKLIILLINHSEENSQSNYALCLCKKWFGKATIHTSIKFKMHKQLLYYVF